MAIRQRMHKYANSTALSNCQRHRTPPVIQSDTARAWDNLAHLSKNTLHREKENQDGLEVAFNISRPCVTESTINTSSRLHESTKSPKRDGAQDKELCGLMSSHSGLEIGGLRYDMDPKRGHGAHSEGSRGKSSA